MRPPPPKLLPKGHTLGFWPVTRRRANSGRFLLAFEPPRGLSVDSGWVSPTYFWCLTPVGPYGRLIAWPAGACVHRFPHGFSLAHFGDSLSVAFFLRSTLLEGRVSSSDRWLCLVDREQEIDLNDDQGNKTKGCSVSAAASVAYRQTRLYFIRWVSEPTCWVPSSSLPDVRRLVSYLIK